MDSLFDSINDSFNLSNLQQSLPECTFPKVGNNDITFEANDLIDIDLIDYCNITTEHNQGNNNLTLMDSYFRQKWTSLENIICSPLVQHKTPVVNNVTLIQNNYLPIAKSKSLLNLSSDECSAQMRCNVKSFYFNVARHTKFVFDFLNFRNLNDSPLQLYFQFNINNKFKSSHFEILKENLTLLPKFESQCPPIASLISHESGKCLIQIAISVLHSSIKNGHSSRPLIVNCYLDIVDLFIYRPFCRFNEQKSIEIAYFENEQYDLLFRLAQVHLDRPFVLKCHLERQSPAVIFSMPLMNSFNMNVKYYLLNPWTCLLYIVRPSDFNISIQMSHYLQDSDTRQPLLVYICDSLKNEESFLLNTFRLQLAMSPRMELSDSCIQICVADNNEIVLTKWKRIDFRNKDQLKHVKVSLGLKLDGQQLTSANWKCTQKQFVLKPHCKEVVFICVNELPVEEANQNADAARLSSSIELCIVQFAGKGREIISKLPLTIVSGTNCQLTD